MNALYLPPLLFRDMVNLESIEFHGADLKNEDLLNLPSGIKSIGFQETKILHGIDEIVIERFSELKNLTLNRSDSISFKSEFVHSVETLKIVDQVDFQDLLIKFPNLKHLMIRGGSTNCSELILKNPNICENSLEQEHMGVSGFEKLSFGLIFMVMALLSTQC